jgi:hypothetical protein
MITSGYLPLASPGDGFDAMAMSAFCCLVASAVGVAVAFALGFAIGKKAGLREANPEVGRLEGREGRGFPVITHDPASASRSDDSLAS